MPSPHPSSYSKFIAREIRAEMARQRKTAAELACVIGRSEGTASNRLSGTYPFNVDEFMQVRKWLGVPTTDLTGPAEARFDHERAAS